MQLDSHQHGPVDFLSTRRRAMLVSPAGSGKTVMAAAALYRVLISKRRTAKVKIGWVANTKEQCQQAEAAIAMFPIRGFGSNEGLATVTVRCAAAGHDWSDRDVLVVDECHHAPAPEWRKQIESCQGARWGMTATPEFEGDDADYKALALEELFGPERYVVDRAAVAHRVAKARVVLLDPEWEPHIAQLIDAETERVYAYRIKHWGGDPFQLRAMIWWQQCVKVGIVGNVVRNLAALDMAGAHAKQGDSVLVLVNQVEHAQWFAECVKAGGAEAVACFSGMGAKARRHALYNFKEGKVKCLVATSLADEGLDVPRASVLVLVSGGKSKAKAEQRTGRVLRAFAGKAEGLIYDFKDSAHRLMAKHSAKRVALYHELGYEVQG